MFKNLHILILILIIAACSTDDGPNLPPFDERVNEAITNLRNDLTAPAQGWRLEYQPTPDAGVFFMLLQFSDKEVTIQSDVVANQGAYFNHTIPYRIDNAQGLELIFETFGVFHFLFEQDQASFGAEFEFIFREKQGENLVFASKTDFFNPTIITFEPASSGDANSFARELAQNLDAFSGVSPQALIPVAPKQQVVLEDQDISVFWSLDVQKRNIRADLAGVGTTLNDVLSNGGIFLDHNTGYALRNGSLVLLDPLSFSLSGQQITINSLGLDQFDMLGPNLCPGGPNNGPRYQGQSSGIGDVTLFSSLLSSDGAGFQPNVYTVNVIFVFDQDGNSLAQGGIIEEHFPDASGFIFLYGVDLVNPDIPIYSTGLILDSGDIFVREFQPTTTEVNRVQLSFTNNYFHSGTPAPGDQQGLKEITDRIFAGGLMYAFDFPASGISVFRLFNPCNSHEVFLVQ